MLSWVRGWFADTPPVKPEALDTAPAIAPPPVKHPDQRPRRGACAARRSLRRAGLGTARQRRVLRACGICTIDDLLRSNPEDLWRHGPLPFAACRRLRRWQRAIAMSERVPAMRPLDCLLARAVHRRSIRAIARSRPAELHRDIQRLVRSSRGSRLLGPHDLPTAEQIAAWVETANRAVAADDPSRQNELTGP